ncbi:MAG: hypothetical protein FJZ01_20830 [Candidatus Sericytochromatia bacterium]|nr:hypothetical protein [Candidatus Tanganyikabacteria bacterium]
MAFKLCCPVCTQAMQADTASGEEFSCASCGAMVDLIDEDFTMVSVPPHDKIEYVKTASMRWFVMVPATRPRR